MPRTNVTKSQLVEITQQVLDGHAERCEAQGYTGEQGLELKIGDDTERHSNTRRELKKCFEALKAGMDWSGASDSTLAIRAHCLRALRLIAVSGHALEDTASFSIRNFAVDNLDGYIIPSSNELRHKLENTISTFQFKANTVDSALVFTWAVMVDGAVVSRGNNQPIHKFVTGLMKPMRLGTALTGDSGLNAAIATLAEANTGGKKWYFYLTNQNVATHYQAFYKYRSLSSCMSKGWGYYSKLHEDEHPMDAYDDSPDWSLMLISELSPEEIQAKLDETRTAGVTNFEYPFITRTMVMPVNKLKYMQDTFRSRNNPPHFVFGKTYGMEKVINFFNSTRKCANNGLMEQLDHICGGRLKAVKSRETGRYILPYVDKANLCFFIEEDGQTWWESTSREHMNEDKGKLGHIVAKCSYQEGTAIYEYAWTLGGNRWTGLGRNALPTGVQTILGTEYGDVDDYYRRITVDGTQQLVPSNWTLHTVDAGYQLRHKCASVHNTWMTLEYLNQSDNFEFHPSYGWLTQQEFAHIEATQND